jgi:hypothetical protein
MVPDNILKEHILSAIEEIERDGVHSGRQSSTYDLKYKGQLYPPKYVISLANKYANGEEHIIGNGDFGTITKTLRETLLNIQNEIMDDPFNRVFPI